MAKFIFSISGPVRVKLDSLMDEFMNDSTVLSCICELTGGYLKVYPTRYRDILRKLPPHLRTLKLVAGAHLTDNLPNLSHLTQVTSLDVSEWYYNDDPICVPSSLQELTLGNYYDKPLDLSHCLKLTKLKLAANYKSSLILPPSFPSQNITRHPYSISSNCMPI